MDYLALKSKYALLGRDFLTWLYRRVDETDGQLKEAGKDTEIFFDDSLTVVGEGDSPAASTFQGQPQSMKSELRAALRSGKKITRAKLHVIRPDGEWSFVLDTDEWVVRSLKVPNGVSDGSDEEAVLLDRLAQLEQIEATLEQMFDAYLKIRVNSKAYQELGESLSAWIS
ncbi:MAG: hypothetical protein CMH54_00750 [Myxococcales bacterium]|nr:hypothetical protein [Myxococcales bacterium]|tara:strand:+ start:845 stop:1354 length:510 start_codon:yes stop_codon:yes gene_type:complete